MEEWKDCKGFEGFYQVSNEGRVRSMAVWSHKYQKVLKRKTPHLNSIETTKDGYKRVLLCLYGVRYHCAVHRLVAQAFIENQHNLPCINHKDENPSIREAERITGIDNTMISRVCRGKSKFAKGYVWKYAI